MLLIFHVKGLAKNVKKQQAKNKEENAKKSTNVVEIILWTVVTILYLVLEGNKDQCVLRWNYDPSSESSKQKKTLNYAKYIHSNMVSCFLKYLSKSWTESKIENEFIEKKKF